MKVCSVVLTGMIAAVTAESQIFKDHANMKATIESKRYCAVNSKKASLAINFSVALENTTSATITIRQPIQVVPLVSRTLQDLQNSKYDLTLYSPDDFGLVKPGSNVPKTRPASRQTNVKPGDVFTGQTMETAFPIALTAQFPKWEALGPGIHFVQLVSDSEIQGTGTFVRITSQPIEITVDKHPKVEKCP